MKKLFLYIGIIVLFLLLDNAAFGQQNDDAQKYLEPERGILADYKFSYEYEYKIRTLFEKGYDSSAAFRMVCLPSFQNEWIVAVKKLDSKFIVLLINAEKHIWTAKESEQVPVKEYSTEIDSSTAEFLTALWVDMVTKSRYPKKPRVGHDGIDYHFSVFILGRGDVSGKIWSPDKDTNTGMLAGIGELLGDYAKADAGKQHEILNAIQVQANELRKRLTVNE